ncbi:MAG: class I SAM-dependent methyltransferase [Promethearchaeota archaeon]
MDKKVKRENKKPSFNHYYNEQQDTPFITKIISCSVSGYSFSFRTAPGVFSKDKIDKGSEVLLNYFMKNENNIDVYGNILDLGCGFGYFGIVLAKMFKNTNVDMVDINTRAVRLAKMNIRKNNVVNANCFKADFSIDFDAFIKTYHPKTYNYILFNPPIKAGKKVIQKMLINSFAILKENCEGKYYMVIKKSLGASSWERWIESTNEYSLKVKKKSGYWIFMIEKKV